jgi:hypothetical protein
VSFTIGALCWVGWSVALALAWTLRRRMCRLADAEHELRGAATAIALLARRTPPLALELDRLNAALADLAEARGAPVAGTAAELEAGRLAQVLGNVAANAAEHGLGPVAVNARREGAVTWLEVANGEGAEVRAPDAARGGVTRRRARLGCPWRGRSWRGRSWRGRSWRGRSWRGRSRFRSRFRRGRSGRGRGLRIATRAARQLGGRLTLEREGGVTRAVVEVPAEEVDGTGRRAA